MSTRTRKREKKVQHGKHIRVLCLNFWLVHLTELWNVLIHHLRTCSPEIIMFLCCRSRRSFEVTTWHISHESTDSVSTNMNTRAHKHAHKESVLVWFREKITVECGSICMRSTRPIGFQLSVDLQRHVSPRGSRPVTPRLRWANIPFNCLFELVTREKRRHQSVLVSLFFM